MSGGSPRPALEQREFPAVGMRVVPQNIGAGIVAADLEVAVLGREPTIENLRDRDRTFAQPETPWLLLAAVPGITLHTDAEISCAHEEINGVGVQFFQYRRYLFSHPGCCGAMK